MFSKFLQRSLDGTVSAENARLLRKHICFISEDQHCKFGFCCMKYWSYIKICFVRRSSGIFLSLRKYLNILTWVLLLGSNQPISDLRPQRLAEWPTPRYARIAFVWTEAEPEYCNIEEMHKDDQRRPVSEIFKMILYLYSISKLCLYILKPFCYKTGFSMYL